MRWWQKRIQIIESNFLVNAMEPFNFSKWYNAFYSLPPMRDVAPFSLRDIFVKPKL